MLNNISLSRARACRRSQRAGQMMILLALLLPVLIGVMALAVDVGIFYYHWSLLQSGADAAALAGAAYLPDNSSRAVSTARSYAQTSGVGAGEITAVAVSSGQQTITVSFNREVSYYFGSILGLKSSAVNVSATAGLRTAVAASNIIPVGIDSRTTYSFGQPITLVQGSSPWGPGNWGPLALGGNGANNFNDKVVNGYSPQVNVGDLLATETGKMTGQSRTAFNNRIANGAAADPGGTFLDHSLDDVRVATVPIVNFSAAAGKSQVQVLGFAQVWLAGVNSQLSINAVFLRQLAKGSKPGTGTNYGAYSTVLIQ